MIPLLGRHLRWLALLCASLFCTTSFVLGLPAPSALAANGNNTNVIIMIGDGMGWQMARAAAIAKGTPLYNSGKGRGLSFQNLSGYTFANSKLVTAYQDIPSYFLPLVAFLLLE